LKPSPRPLPAPHEIPVQEHTITHDLARGTVTVHLRASRHETSNDGRTENIEVTHSNYTVSKANPADAVLNATHEFDIRRPEGITRVEASEVVSSDAASFRFLSEVEVWVHGKRHFHKSWNITVPRKLN
jgi:hypothetical protein